MKSKEISHCTERPIFIHKDGYECWHINGEEFWYIVGGIRHRIDGPAIIKQNVQKWFIYGEDITDKVESWIKDNNYPDYKKWDTYIKIEFKLRFL